MNKPLYMRPHGAPGLLISFCGLDGCGKTTMIKARTEDLQCDGYDVFLTKQPTDAMRQSDIFRTYMDSENHSQYEYRALSLMAAADRLQHVHQVILPALQDGKVVISDRYFYSCLANLRARGYEKDEWIYEIAKGIPKPDVSIFLDVPVHVSLARVRARPTEKDRYIDTELQHRLQREYQSIAYENQYALIPSWVDPELTYKMIKDDVWRKLK